MINQLKNSIKKLRFISVIRISVFGYLKESGWIKSAGTGLPVDSRGEELPWFTYPAIQFIESRLNNQLEVFEYGSGNSTIWFTRRVASIISMEHDRNWYDNMVQKFEGISNIDYNYKLLEDNQYSSAILNYNHKFDILILDGRDRVKCCLNSLKALKENGIIIWDNSDRAKYLEGYEFLEKNGFKRIDFWGLGPINANEWCTSIFYRANNVFGI